MGGTSAGKRRRSRILHPSKNLPPGVAKSQPSGPVCYVFPIDSLRLHLQDPRDIPDVLLRAACFEVFELLQDHVFRCRESDLEARTEASLYAPAKLGATELALVRNEDVDFDARFEMDDVELRPLTNRVHDRLAIAIEVSRWERETEGVHLLRVEVDHDIDIVSKSGLPVDRSRLRTCHKVTDPQSVENFDESPEQFRRLHETFSGRLRVESCLPTSPDARERSSPGSSDWRDAKIDRSWQTARPRSWYAKSRPPGRR